MTTENIKRYFVLLLFWNALYSFFIHSSVGVFSFLLQKKYLIILQFLQINLRVTNLEVNVLQQFEGLSVESQVKQYFRVVHVVGEVSWRREVTERHHLFGAVHDHRLIDVGSSRLWLFLH